MLSVLFFQYTISPIQGAQKVRKMLVYDYIFPVLLLDCGKSFNEHLFLKNTSQNFNVLKQSGPTSALLRDTFKIIGVCGPQSAKNTYFCPKNHSVLQKKKRKRSSLGIGLNPRLCSISSPCFVIRTRLSLLAIDKTCAKP